MFELVVQNLSEKQKNTLWVSQVEKFQQSAALLLQGCTVMLVGTYFVHLCIILNLILWEIMVDSMEVLY